MSDHPIQNAEGLLREWYIKIDTAIAARNKCVAMMARTIPGPRIEAFGSGFFYLKDGWPFFITAEHVINDTQKSLQQGRAVAIITPGRQEKIFPSGQGFYIFKEIDLAIMPLWKNRPSSYAHVEFFTPNEINLPSNIWLYAFTGFPASKNKAYTNQELKPHQRIITFPEPSKESIDPQNLFKLFPANSKDFHTSTLDRTTIDLPQSIAGMSGGPIFAIGGTLENPSLHVYSMGISWLDKKSIKALRFDFIDILLSQHLNW